VKILGDEIKMVARLLLRAQKARMKSERVKEEKQRLNQILKRDGKTPKLIEDGG